MKKAASVLGLMLMLAKIVYAVDVDRLRKEITRFLPRITVNFPDRRGLLIGDNDLQSTYRVTAPYQALETDDQFIMVTKNTQQAWFVAQYTGAENVAAATSAITGFVNVYMNSSSSYAYPINDYAVKTQLQQNRDGYGTDTLFYKGIPVTVLNVAPGGGSATITIGLFDTKKAAVAKAVLPLMPTQPYQPAGLFDHLAVNGSIITVKGYGPQFDGDYDVAALAKDSCLSGNCVTGNGRKVLAGILDGHPQIRIMQGKFRRNVFLGNGVMLVDGEGPVTDGTYEFKSFEVSYLHNSLGAKAVFHPKRGDEMYKGFFTGFLDDGIGSALSTYKKFVVCRFGPDKENITGPWLRDVYQPNREYLSDVYEASAEGKADEARILAENALFDAATIRQQENAKCSCCGGRGYTTQQDYVHFQLSGNNYMVYSRVVCTCCNGTGRQKDQTSTKPKNGLYIVK